MSEMRIVPVEPTEAMLDAAMRREDDEPLSDWGKSVPAPHAEIYKAMIAAAPRPVTREKFDALFVPAAELRSLRTALSSLREERDRLAEQLHYANGTADLAMKHRDEAEERVRVLERQRGPEYLNEAVSNIAVGLSLNWGANWDQKMRDDVAGMLVKAAKALGPPADPIDEQIPKLG